VLIKAATHRDEPGPGLTERELEILQLMVDGLSNPEIAKKRSWPLDRNSRGILMKLDGCTSCFDGDPEGWSMSGTRKRWAPRRRRSRAA
jgi:hypothetical protein